MYAPARMLSAAVLIAGGMSVDVQQPDLNSSSADPLDCGWKFEYNLIVQSCHPMTSCFPPAVPRAPIITVTDMTHSSGCGGDNTGCTCKVTKVDNTENFETTFNMKGVGTCGTWTGLDFACHFSVEWMDGSACPCTLHIDDPYAGSNHWSVCNCFGGYTATVGSGGHQFSISDTVYKSGTHSLWHQEDPPEPEPENSDPLDSLKDVADDFTQFIEAIKGGDVVGSISAGASTVGAILDCAGLPEIGIPLEILGTLFGGIFGSPDISNQEVVAQLSAEIQKLGDEIKVEIQNMEQVMVAGMTALSSQMAQEFEQLSNAIASADADIKNYIRQKQLSSLTQEYATVMAEFQALMAVPLSTSSEDLFNQIQVRWTSDPGAQVITMISFLGGWQVVVGDAIGEMNSYLSGYDAYTDVDGSDFTKRLAEYNKGMAIVQHLIVYQQNVIMAAAVALFRVNYLCKKNCLSDDFQVINATVRNLQSNLRSKFTETSWLRWDGIEAEPGNLLLTKSKLGVDEHGSKQCRMLCEATAGCCAVDWNPSSSDGQCSLYDKCQTKSSVSIRKDTVQEFHAMTAPWVNSQLKTGLRWTPFAGQAADQGRLLASSAKQSLGECEQRCQNMVGCCTFQHNAAQEICNLYDRCTDMVAPMNQVVGWTTYSPQPQPWGKLRQAWCKVGGLVPEQYVGQHLKRLQNLTFSSAAYGLVRCQRACQVYVGCNSIAWSPTYYGGDCFLYPKPVPLPARYSVAYDYHSYYTSQKPCTSMTVADFVV